MADKFKINKKQEAANVETIRKVGLMMGIQNTIKKINEHDKDKKSSRTRNGFA
jgi:hypothetical protein